VSSVGLCRIAELEKCDRANESETVTYLDYGVPRDRLWPIMDAISSFAVLWYVSQHDLLTSMKITRYRHRQLRSRRLTNNNNTTNNNHKHNCSGFVPIDQFQLAISTNINLLSTRCRLRKDCLKLLMMSLADACAFIDDVIVVYDTSSFQTLGFHRVSENTTTRTLTAFFANITGWLDTRLESRWSSGNTLASDWRQPGARVQHPNASLSSLTQATFLSGSVKCEGTSKQWVIADENCGCKCSRRGSAL